jgi:hypothetical protein
VNLSVRQTVIAPAAVPAFYVPSLMDLPAVAGMRNPSASEPAVYVVNENRPVQRSYSRSSGPRIVHAAMDGGWDGPAESPGARIIHLTVPVGPPR